MKAPFFYAPGLQDSDDEFVLDEASSRHCIQVLRKKPGDSVLLTDGNGLSCLAFIATADKRRCVVTVNQARRVAAPEPRLGIAVAFTRNPARIEWFVEKATEIGISDIYPLVCTRSTKVHYRKDRLGNIMVSAMLQSQQYLLPRLHDECLLDDFVGKDTGYPDRYLAHCEPEEKTPLQSLLVPGRSALVLIGPEGDFTPEEIALALAHDYRPVSLGENRLRTETAALVACVLMNAAGGL